MVEEMTESKNIWMWAAAALLCTTIGASYFALNYQSQNTKLQSDYEALLADVEGLTINIDLLIDYGDGNVVWLNDTRVPLDINLLKALELHAEIEYTTSEYGAFVTRVDGIGDDPTKYWLWFWYDTEAESWAYGPSASDFWALHDGDVVSWVYSAP
jgi:hypothetical protein